MEKTEITVHTRIPSGPALPPALGANFFQFAFVGGEIQLLVGNLDLMQMHEHAQRTRAGKAAADTTIEPLITHRFALSGFGFDQLRARVDEIGLAVDEARKKEEAAR